MFPSLTTADIDWNRLLDTRLLHLTGFTAAISPTVLEILWEAMWRAAAAGVPVRLSTISRASSLIVSCSGEGAVALVDGVPVKETASPVTVVDRLGAGDGLAAGFLHGWLSGDRPVALRQAVTVAAIAMAQTPRPARPAANRPPGGWFHGRPGPDLDRFLISPAHYACAIYAALGSLGRLASGAFETLNTDGTTLEMIGAEHSPGFELTTGSFGQALSQAAGIAFARSPRGATGRTGRVHVRR